MSYHGRMGMEWGTVKIEHPSNIDLAYPCLIRRGRGVGRLPSTRNGYSQGLFSGSILRVYGS